MFLVEQFLTELFQLVDIQEIFCAGSKPSILVKSAKTSLKLVRQIINIPKQEEFVWDMLFSVDAKCDKTSTT